MSANQNLFAAIRGGDRERVAALLTDDPRLASSRDDAGLSAIMTALYHRQADIAADLRRAIDALDVFEAAALGEEERLAALLAEDAAVIGAPAADGFTPLHLASFFGREAAVELLLARGADPNALVANESRLRPLHSAAAARSIAVVRRLLDGGADPNVAQRGGWTPLHAAFMHGDDAMASLLLERGADPERAADDGRLPRQMRPNPGA